MTRVALVLCIIALSPLVGGLAAKMIANSAHTAVWGADHAPAP